MFRLHVFVLALLSVFAMACQPFESSEADQSEVMNLRQEADTLNNVVIANLVTIRKQISDHTGPIAQRALEFESGLNMGDFDYGRDTFTEQILLCNYAVDNLGQLEYIAFQDESNGNVVNRQYVHPGISYGSARTYMAQACVSLKAAQNSLNAALFGIEQEQPSDLIAYFLLRSHAELTFSNDALVTARANLPS